METKICKVCGQEKNVTSFLRSYKKSGGIVYRNICSNCNSKRHRETVAKKADNMVKEYRMRLEMIRSWVNTHDLISESTEYSKGYKAGFIQAKEVIKCMLND